MSDDLKETIRALRLSSTAKPLPRLVEKTYPGAGSERSSEVLECSECFGAMEIDLAFGKENFRHAEYCSAGGDMIKVRRSDIRLVLDAHRANENAMIEMGAMVEWVAAALDGEELSEFALSFPMVQKAADLNRRST